MPRGKPPKCPRASARQRNHQGSRKVAPIRHDQMLPSNVRWQRAFQSQRPEFFGNFRRGLADRWARSKLVPLSGSICSGNSARKSLLTGAANQPRTRMRSRVAGTKDSGSEAAAARGHVMLTRTGHFPAIRSPLLYWNATQEAFPARDPGAPPIWRYGEGTFQMIQVAVVTGTDPSSSQTTPSQATGRNGSPPRERHQDQGSAGDTTFTSV